VRARLVTVVLLGLALAACGEGPPPASPPEAPPADTETYREPEGRFEAVIPAGWHLTTVDRDGSAFWRWTPEPVEDPAQETESDFMFALVPLPEEAKLTADSLEEVAEYVRDIVVRTAARDGTRYRASPARKTTLGGRDAVRFDLTATKDGRAHRIALIAASRPEGAAVLQFGSSAEGADELLARLERCAAGLRLPSGDTDADE
jgi:hypothetical protein